MPKAPPRVAGPLLKAVRIAAETTAGGVAVRELFRRGLRVTDLAKLPYEWRGDVPLDVLPVRSREPRSAEADASPAPSAAPAIDEARALPAWPRTSASYAGAYSAKITTPIDVTERALTAARELRGRKPSMNILTGSDEARARREAEAAALRHASGSPRSALDGVPFLVKDEFNVAGLPTRLGSLCDDEVLSDHDSTVVARLRDAGAIFVGKTVLTEWGMSPIGNNPNYAMPRNAHHPTRAPGGSSTGSAVGVALGIAPLACGGDGGGSIRIPASLNGIFGIKPTFGRVSRAGDGFKGSVAHAGPLASSTACLAAFLDIVASDPDPEDVLTLRAPPPPAGGFGSRMRSGVRGLRIGVPDSEWRDATDYVGRACRGALAALEREGAVLVPIDIPLARYAAPIGYCVIGPESLAAHRREWMEQRSRLRDDLRVTFAVLSGLTALEQIDAQRLRAGLRRQAAEALREVDVIAMPTTAITAPKCTEEQSWESYSDAASMDGLCRFAFLANLTGLPAGTAPVGVDADGLPIGLQIIGDAWDEAAVLGVMAHLERTGVAVVRRPAGAVELY